MQQQAANRQRQQKSGWKSLPSLELTSRKSEPKSVACSVAWYSNPWCTSCTAVMYSNVKTISLFLVHHDSEQASNENNASLVRHHPTAAAAVAARCPKERVSLDRNAAVTHSTERIIIFFLTIDHHQLLIYILQYHYLCTIRL